MWNYETDGASDKELSQTRRVGGKFVRPRTGGRSFSTSRLWHQDPSAKAGFAPASRWAKEVWGAFAPSSEDRDNMKPKELLSAFIKSKPLGCQSWRGVRGPSVVCARSLERINWKWAAPFKFESDKGEVIYLTEHPPKLVERLLHEGALRSLQETLGKKAAEKDADFKEARACLDPAKEVARSSKTSEEGKRWLEKAVCNAVWTRTRAREADYKVATVDCPKCGLDFDDVFHRVWLCSHHEVKKARDAVAPQWLQFAAKNAGRASITFTRGGWR